jgi:hypothetical protein
LPTSAARFNDVLFRIKTTDEILDPLRVFVSDKEFVKLYVKAIAGDRYCVPTIDVIRSAELVDVYDFPSRCCIKPTHASGRVMLRKNGEEIDRDLLKRWLKLDFYRRGREANYRTLKPKLIIEPLIFDDPNVPEYRFFCLDGVVKLIQVNIDRRKGRKSMFLDRDWNQLDFTMSAPKIEQPMAGPSNLPEMLDVAAGLSANFGFVRVDLYSNGSSCLVGEITNCDGNATARFNPESGEATASRIIFG